MSDFDDTNPVGTWSRAHLLDYCAREAVFPQGITAEVYTDEFLRGSIELYMEAMDS